MPSKFEPCGLSQLIAMRYGSLPIVRATGGLEDTVTGYPLDNSNGFKFWAWDFWRLLQRRWEPEKKTLLSGPLLIRARVETALKRGGVQES